GSQAAKSFLNPGQENLAQQGRVPDRLPVVRHGKYILARQGRQLFDKGWTVSHAVQKRKQQAVKLMQLHVAVAEVRHALDASRRLKSSDRTGERPLARVDHE